MNAAASQQHPIVAELDRRTVMRLWLAGKDTLAIAEEMKVAEGYVYSILTRLQNDRYALRTGGAA